MLPGSMSSGSSMLMSAVGAGKEVQPEISSSDDMLNPCCCNSSMHWRNNHKPFTFFRKQIFPDTPPRLVKFSAHASPVTHGVSRTVPTKDQVPELMKAQSLPTVGIAAMAEAVS